MHTVWLTKKVIELVCSATFAQAAQDRTLELNQASKDIRPDGADRPSPTLSVRERQLRAEFMGAARRESGYAGQPLCAATTLELGASNQQLGCHLKLMAASRSATRLQRATSATAAAIRNAE